MDKQKTLDAVRHLMDAMSYAVDYNNSLADFYRDIGEPIDMKDADGRMMAYYSAHRLVKMLHDRLAKRDERESSEPSEGGEND